MAHNEGIENRGKVMESARIEHLVEPCTACEYIDLLAEARGSIIDALEIITGTDPAKDMDRAVMLSAVALARIQEVMEGITREAGLEQ